MSRGRVDKILEGWS